MGLVGHRVEQERFIPVYVQDHPEDVLLLNTSARKNQRMHQQTESPLFPFWVEDRGLSFFLAFLVLVTIVVPMITLSRYGRMGLGLMSAPCFSQVLSRVFAREFQCVWLLCSLSLSSQRTRSSNSIHRSATGAGIRRSRYAASPFWWS